MFTVENSDKGRNKDFRNFLNSLMVQISTLYVLLSEHMFSFLFSCYTELQAYIFISVSRASEFGVFWATCITNLNAFLCCLLIKHLDKARNSIRWFLWFRSLGVS